MAKVLIDNTGKVINVGNKILTSEAASTRQVWEINQNLAVIGDENIIVWDNFTTDYDCEGITSWTGLHLYCEDYGGVGEANLDYIYGSEESECYSIAFYMGALPYEEGVEWTWNMPNRKLYFESAPNADMQAFLNAYATRIS